MMRTICYSIVLLLSATLLPAATINVPADQTTITAAIAAANTGDVVLVAAGTYAESVNLNKDITLRLAGNFTINSLAGVAGATVDLQSFTLTVGDANSTAYAGAITGTGLVTKVGAGTLTLSGSSNYSGGTNCNGGFITASSNTALGTGTFTMNTAGKRLILADGVALNNAIAIAGGTPDNDQSVIQGPATTAATLNGNISITGTPGGTNPGHFNGGAGGLVLNGTITSTVQIVQRSGTVTYNGAMTYTSFAPNGTTNIATANILPASPITVSLRATATINITANQTVGAITFGNNANSVINLLSGTLTLQGDLTQTNNQAAAINGPGTLDLGGATRTFNITQNTTTIAASITNGGIQKDGGGTLVLSGPSSTFNAGVTLNGGFVRASSSAGLGTGTFTLTSTGKRLLAGAAGLTFSNPIVINGGNPDAGRGTIEGPTAGAAATFTGGITINATPSTGGHFKGEAGSGLNIASSITSSVPVLHIADTVTYSFSSGGTYPEIQITGTALIGANDGLNPNAIITVAMSGTGQINAQTFTQNYSNVLNLGNPLGGANGGTATLTSGTGSNRLNVSLNSYADFSHTVSGNLDLNGSRSLVISDGTQLTDLTLSAVVSNGTLVKQGAGRLVSGTATSTYAGGTQILAGSFSIDGDARLGAVPGAATPGNVLINGGILEVRAGITISANRGIALGPNTGTGTGTIEVTGTNTVQYGGDIDDNGAGTGNLVLLNTGTLQLLAANNYAGTTTVTGGGKLRLRGDTGAIAATSSIVINDSGVLEIDNTAGAGVNRIGDSVPVTLNNASLTLTAPTNTLRTETIGLLSTTGASQISLVATSNTAGQGDAQLTASDLALSGSTRLFRLALGSVTTEIGNLFSTATTNGTAFPGTSVLDGVLLSANGTYTTAEGLIGDGAGAVTTFVSRQSGQWNATGTWYAPPTGAGAGQDADGIPDSDDLVVITNNHTVTVDTAHAALGVIFNAPSASSGTINGTNTLTLGNRGIEVTALNNNQPTISCTLSFGSGPANILMDNPGRLNLSTATAGAIVNCGVMTLRGRGEVQIELGAGGTANVTALAAGTLATDIRVLDTMRLRLRIPCSATTVPDEYAQRISFVNGTATDRNFVISRASGAGTLVHFNNLLLEAGSHFSVDEDNIALRVSLLLNGNAAMLKKNTNSDDIDLVNVTNAGMTPYTLTLDAESVQTLTTVLFGNIGTNAIADIRKCNVDIGTSATTNAQTIDGELRFATTNLGSLDIFTGRLGTNFLSGNGRIVVGASRSIRGYVQEVAADPRAVNQIQVRVEIPAGETGRFQTERNNDNTLNGWVHFTNVSPNAGSIADVSGIGNGSRLLMSFDMLGSGTFNNTNNGNETYIGNIIGTGLLTYSGNQPGRFVGTMGGNADLATNGSNTSAAIVLQDTGTELTPQLVGTLGGRSLTCLTDQIVIVRRDPGAGTIALPSSNLGPLHIEAGRTGASDMLTSATIINTQGRTVRTYVEDDAAAAKTNTMAATVNVTANASLIADRIGTDTTVPGTVLFGNVVPAAGITVTLNRTNDLNCLADIAGNAAGAFVSSAVTNNARVRNVTGAASDVLTASGANVVVLIGTVSATVGAETGATLRIVKSSPVFVGAPGILLNGGTVDLEGTGATDVAETVGIVTVNTTTSVLALTPTATSDVRLTAASISVTAGALLRYNRTTVAPNTSNFILTGTPNGTPFADVHINAVTGGSAYSTILEGGFEEGLVLPKVVNNFLFTGPGTVQVGQTANFTVTARDSTNAVIPSFNGTVTISISSPAGITTPVNPYTYVPGAGMGGDAGVHVFPIRFDTGAGASYFLTVTDNVRSTSILVQIDRGTTSVNWPNPTITYGDPLTGTQLNATGVNLSGAAVPGTYAYTPGAGTVPGAGSQPLNVTFTPSNLVDYFPSNGAATLTVLQKALTISPDNSTRNYGQPNALTATLSGLVNGDDINDFPGLTLATAATTASVPGTYNVTASGAVNPNYAITYTGNPATLTVNPAPLTATATTLIARINQPIPQLTVTYSGFVLGQNESALETQAVVSTTAVQGNPIGDYPITFTTVPVDTDGHYAITTANGILHIFPPQPLVDSKTVSAGTGLATSIALTGQSFSGNALTYSIVTQPAHGTVSIVGTSAVYISAPGYIGPDSFTFRGFDGFDFSLPGTITLDVKGAPTVTSAPAVSPNPGIAGVALTGVIGADYGTASWNWGDGSPADTGATVSHVYTTPGVYTATITITSPEGLVTSTTVSVFVGFDLAGGGNTGATPPGVTGILVGGAGAGKAQGGTGKISCNYVKREKTYYQGSLGQLSIPANMTQEELTNIPGVLTIGSGANAALFQFSLTKTGKGKSTGLPTLEFSVKKKSFKFKAQRSDLTSLTEALGAPREQGVKKGEVITLLVPVTLQIGNKVFLALTFQVKYQQINAGGKGSL